MKRKWAYVALPLLLTAGIFGVKWRAEHPTPTKEDLEVRALMKSCVAVHFAYAIDNQGRIKTDFVKLNQADLQLFIDSFWIDNRKEDLSRNANRRDYIDWRLAFELDYVIGKVHKDDVSKFIIRISPNGHTNLMMISNLPKSEVYKLHPATAKRWRELLLANPRIGPELRARMK